MDRNELNMLNDYKVKELKKRLAPITDYTKLKEGQRLFHENDINIFNTNIFSEISDDLKILWYKNKDGKLYDMSASNWYLYDETIAEEVEEYFTPKLYSVTDKLKPTKHIMIVAFNKDHLKKCFIKEMFMPDMTKEEFFNRFVCVEFQYVDGFKVILE